MNLRILDVIGVGDEVEDIAVDAFSIACSEG